ncbi:MAG: hypothetical protein JWO05_969 [Gemmatimonadetes bacterium]|nr:hypothetical protein [Gemmatimonadota bacterium]
MKSFPGWLIALALASACQHATPASTLPADTEAPWNCAPSRGDIAARLITWTRQIVSDTGAAAAERRTTYQLPQIPRSEVRPVAERETCARAGLAYGTIAKPGVPNSVVVILAGDRYLAINLSAIMTSGEYLTAVILDRNFKPIAWLTI